MKNMFLKTIGGAALAILMLAVFAQVQVSAQDNNTEEKTDEQTQEDSATRRSNTRALEGVWDIQVTRRNCTTGAVISTFAAMHTFMRGGTMIDWGTGSLPSLRSPGQGIWYYESRRQYSSAFQFFRYNADGTLAGKQIGRGQIELSHDGNSYSTTGMGQVLDINGNVIATNCNTSTATRFQ